MASIACTLTVLLICQNQHHIGVQGKIPAVFSSAGGTATLPCRSAVNADCSSIAWSKGRPGVTQWLVLYGYVQPSVVTQRVSLLHNCSLHLTDVTTEDAESAYICWQYPGEGRTQYVYNAPVHLTVLYVSSSSSETEMVTGGHMTLHCILHSFDWCLREANNYGVHLSLLDEEGKELKSNRNDKDRCKIQLPVELRDPNPFLTQKTWACQLTAEGQVQTTAIIRIQTPNTTPETTAPSSPTGLEALSPSQRQLDGDGRGHTLDIQTMTKTVAVDMKGGSVLLKKYKRRVFTGIVLITGVAVSISLVAAALTMVMVIHNRATNARKKHHGSSQSISFIHSIIQSAPPPSPSANEGGDLHYAALLHQDPNQDEPSAAQSEDTVSYRSIKDYISRPVDPSDVATHVNQDSEKMESEDTVAHSPITELSGGENQDSSRPAETPADPKAVCVTEKNDDSTQN